MGTRIGPIAVRNRITFTAPAPAYAGLDEDANRPTDELAAYWEQMARGGVGLLITEPQSVHPTSTPNPRTVENVSDDIIPQYRKVADAVHDGGGKIFGSLWHAGLLASPGYRNRPLWAPSAVRAPMGALVPAGGGGLAYAMERRDIRELTVAFAAAARRLAEATFDGVELNAANGFLLAEFLSPAVNFRDDEYGGSLENRCRFVAEIVGAVRAAVGPGMAVGIRLSADPYIEPGLRESELPDLAQHLARIAAPDYISLMPALLPDASFAQGTGSDVALRVKAGAGIPVIYNGLLTDPAAAASLVEQGIDLVGMTRAILADPQMPTKLQTGRQDRIRMCIACNQTCAGGPGGVTAMATPYCLLNPAPAEVEQLSRNQDGEGQTVLVIGAGPAGLEAARLARLRGFSVTVWERDSQLGGQIATVAKAPKRAAFWQAVEFYRHELQSIGVTFHYGQEATVEAVDALGPDAVIVATGSKPTVPAWAQPGNGSSPGATVLDVRAALGGAQLGARVVIAMAEVDVGYQALPLAEFLADRGHEVTIVSTAFEPCLNQDFATSEQLYRRLGKKKVRLIAMTEVTGVTSGEVAIRNIYTREAGALPADSCVVSNGGAADDSLLDQLREHRPNVVGVGDCIAPRDIAGAISDGLRAMEKLRVAVHP